MAVSDRAPTRLTRVQSRAQTRQRLVDAAMRVFARQGYAGASVNTIAEEAGYTVGALYSNFATKDELFWAAFEQHCAGELAALDALVAGAGTWQELLTAVTNRFTDLDEQHRQWWCLWAELWLYAQRHPEDAHRLATVQQHTRAVIARAMARDGRPADPERVALVHALWTGFMLYRLADPHAIAATAFGRAAHLLATSHDTDAQAATALSPHEAGVERS
jgi:AcrR family transcriptional regulator